jgi:hypothetical protein
MVREEQRPDVEFAIDGRERTGGHESIVVAYRSKELRPESTKGIYRHLKNPRSGLADVSRLPTTRSNVFRSRPIPRFEHPTSSNADTCIATR